MGFAGHKTVLEFVSIVQILCIVQIQILTNSLYKYKVLYKNCVPVVQWLEHCVSSAKVVGSIPREHTY